MIVKSLGTLRRNRKGSALVEYALLIAGVALIGAAAVSVFGHKTSDMVGLVASILPGAHTADNASIQSGHLLETSPVGTQGSIALDVSGGGQSVQSGKGLDRLGENVFGPGEGATNGINNLIVETK
jgi:pilus assembly protein Flp/PilA